MPGKVLLALDPRALARIAAARDERVVMVSATNGKTTLCAMLASICEGAGQAVVHNMTGANLRSGIATTLMSATRHADVALLETDEATLPLVAPDVEPTVIVLGNLFRDQLDRYGELETLADRWRETLVGLDPRRVTVAYNVDDPLIAELVVGWSEHSRAGGVEPRVVPYGIADHAVGRSGLPHAADSTFCRRCAAPLDYARSFVGHLGHWRCTSCGLARPEPVVAATGVHLDGLAGSDLVIGTPRGEVRTRLRIPGLYNAYNALGAVAAAVALGLDTADVTSGLAGFSPAFGRFERVPVPGGGTLTLLLVKNPTGLNEVVRTLTSAGVDLAATLFALNDGIADGRDTSWIWDADVEPLLESVPSLVVTGDRAADFALRAVYGGMEADRIVLEEDVEAALFELIARARDLTAHGHAYALVTYTAMLRMRQVISDRGWVPAYWRGHA